MNTTEQRDALVPRKGVGHEFFAAANWLSVSYERWLESEAKCKVLRKYNCLHKMELRSEVTRQKAGK